jgi:hypothetical protein
MPSSPTLVFIIVLLFQQQDDKIDLDDTAAAIDAVHLGCLVGHQTRKEGRNLHRFFLTRPDLLSNTMTGTPEMQILASLKRVRVHDVPREQIGADSPP